ncbi:MAG: hypothetical protein ACFFDR_09505, partial [Candidatus Thorarchaeota archaeon]
MDNRIPEDLKEALNIFETPKFMLTKDAKGEPNSSLVMTWTIYDENRLVYGDFMTFKSRQNLLDGNSQMSLLVMTMNLDSWLIKANFESFHRNDEVYEFIAMTPLFRYNQYTNARGAGLADPISISSKYGISKLSVLTGFLKAKIGAGKVPSVTTDEGNMSPPILRRFSQMAAVKILSFIDDDGYPAGFPEFGMLPVHSNRVIMKRTQERKRGYHIEDGQRVAISLVTLEPAAFQMKGTFRELNANTAIVELDRVYVCSLPRPG